MYSPLFTLLFLCMLVCNTLAKPVSYENVEDDVAAVGSFIREVRQLAPTEVAEEVKDLLDAGNAPKSRDNKKHKTNVYGKSDEGGYHRTYGSDAEGEKGYLKGTYGRGDQGYKTLDTFHKQDGDKYEFESQTNYGKGQDDDSNKKHHKKKKNSDHEGAGTMVDTDYAEGEEDHGEASEHSHHTESDDSDSGHYEEKEPESTSYDHNKNYSSEGGDEESYEMHSAYSYSDDKGNEGEGDHY